MFRFSSTARGLVPALAMGAVLVLGCNQSGPTEMSIPAAPGSGLSALPGGAPLFNVSSSSNTMGDHASALGLGNTASGRASVAMGRAVVSSGQYSVAMNNETLASGMRSVAMGYQTDAAGQNSLAGGYGSVATGRHSVAFGHASSTTGESSFATGRQSKADGAFSFAAGRESKTTGLYAFALGYRANANHNGSFVFADSRANTVTSTADDQFLVRASGGTIFQTNQSGTSGVQLLPGSGAWTALSDVNMKENFRAVDGEEILGRIAAMDIREWNYISQDASVRHIGPTAQDFYAAFGLGETETGINTVDADGIALVAIQALERRNRELEAALADRDSKLEMLAERLTVLEQALIQYAD